MKEVVKELREQLKLSQMQVAEITGVSIVSVNRAETGKVKLSTYEKIIEGLKAYQKKV